MLLRLELKNGSGQRSAGLLTSRTIPATALYSSFRFKLQAPTSLKIRVVNEAPEVHTIKGSLGILDKNSIIKVRVF